jgi:hypothetical protein
MKRFLFLIALIVGAMPANAQVFGELNRITVTKTMLRFGAINPANDKVINDYMKLAHCEEYRKNFRDDFAMNDLREKIRAKIKKEAVAFPDSYYFKSKMYLDKYNFTTKSYPLVDSSQLRNVNSFELINEANEVCISAQQVTSIPGNIGAVLDQPIYLTSIPMEEDKAKALLQRMNEKKNFSREIYVRFSLMTVFAPPVTDTILSQRYNMDAQLLAIEFFEDPDYKKPIWVFTRS